MIYEVTWGSTGKKNRFATKDEVVTEADRPLVWAIGCKFSRLSTWLECRISDIKCISANCKLGG